MLKPKFFISMILIFSLITIFIIQKKDVIFQEGNPIPLAIAISKMIIQDHDIAEVKEAGTNDKTYGYLVKLEEMEPFINLMEDEG
ncbi:hypothetical protein J2S19_004676 [Metabacillus malikii]|uniref:Uncharacterized protein n=1 Tax=Metabacillus malikii TaxID=1504265 RepID=A0ABT9ZNG6_9BACI|nr:hypothetical protein [Metabacillus malikii]